MKTTSMTMMSVFLVLALACVIAQEFAIHLLYNRCESLNSAYNQLALSKTQILYIPYAASEPIPGYSPVDPHTETVTLAEKNINPFNIIKKLGNSETLEGQISLDEQGQAIDKFISRFSEAKSKPFEVYVLFLCDHLSIDRNEKIDLIHSMPDVLQAMSRYESGIDLPNELFVSYEVPEKIE